MSGKGDKRRPTDEKKFSENWDRIFNKQQQQPVQPNHEELKRQAQDRSNG